MGLDVLLDSLRREAYAERDAVLAAARAEAEQLIDGAERRADEQRAGAVTQRRAALLSDAERRAGVARRTARGAVLQARQDLLDRVFSEARRQLPAAGLDEAWRASLPRRLASALAFVADEGPVEVRCPPSLAPLLAELSAGRPDLHVTAAPDILAGFRVRSVSGRVDVDDTLEAHLEARRAELSRAVLAELCVGP